MNGKEIYKALDDQEKKAVRTAYAQNTKHKKAMRIATLISSLFFCGFAIWELVDLCKFIFNGLEVLSLNLYANIGLAVFGIVFFVLNFINLNNFYKFIESKAEESKKDQT
ncbi:MAG: hypothetical protein RR248_00835 [Clostridia bacterium]